MGITRKMKSELPVAWMTLTITNASSIDEDNVVHSSNRHDVLCCENYSEVNLFTENKLPLEVPKDAHMVDVLVLACCALFQKSDTIQVLPWVRLAQGANDIDMGKQVQEYIPTGMNFRLVSHSDEAIKSSIIRMILSYQSRWEQKARAAGFASVAQQQQVLRAAASIRQRAAAAEQENLETIMLKIENMEDGAKTDLIMSPEAFVVDALVLACSALSDNILNLTLNFGENAFTSNVRLKELGICSEAVLRLVKHTDDEINQTMIQAMLSQHELRQIE